MLKTYDSNEWQYQDVERNPDEQRCGYRLRGGERRIEVIRR